VRVAGYAPISVDGTGSRASLLPVEIGRETKQAEDGLARQRGRAERMEPAGDGHRRP
jgi:hypothetical protein